MNILAFSAEKLIREISLVLLMINRINVALEHLVSLSLVPNIDVTLRNHIRTAHLSFKTNIDHYYNDEFTGF